ncbi:MAG: hypothetical protein HY936_10275 [Nitrosomonadales bacterium]|nr:hypothetical protein [Nitrosomonadales bacterium]
MGNTYLKSTRQQRGAAIVAVMAILALEAVLGGMFDASKTSPHALLEQALRSADPMGRDVNRRQTGAAYRPRPYGYAYKHRTPRTPAGAASWHRWQEPGTHFPK